MAIFDKEAGSYDSWYETKLGSFIDKVETDLVLSMFDIKEGMKVLDVGCGTGNFSVKLAKMGCKVIGVDISEEMLGKARAKAVKEKLDIEFVNMDVYDLKLEENSFDAVFSMAAFEFITEPQEAFDEMLRVAKKGAQLLIGTIHKNSQWGMLYMSTEVRDNSVFKYADFKALSDLRALRGAQLMKLDECLFIPPNAKEEDISMEKESELSKTERGGYICALWEK